MNKFTCPRFVFCPHKPHFKGNEYHAIYCGEIGIMYGWEIVEGRDHLIPMGRSELKTNTNMNTLSLILQLTRLIWSTGKAVVMDWGFCVLKGLF